MRKHPQLSAYSVATANSKTWSLLAGLPSIAIGAGSFACRNFMILDGACVDFRPLRACVMCPNTVGVALSGQ